VSRAKDANPSPVPSTGFLPLSTVLACSRRVHTPRMYLRKVRRLPWLPDASRPCSMPLASLERPKELSLPGEPHPLSRAVASLRSRSTTASAALDQLVAIAFAGAPALCRAPHEVGRTTHEPGRRFPAVARPTGLMRLRAPSRSTSRYRPGSPVRSRHARSEALLPPGARSHSSPLPWPGRGCRVGALLGFIPPREFSGTAPGPVSRRGARVPRRVPGRARVTCVTGGSAIPSR
jgi:hypothetical protein